MSKEWNPLPPEAGNVSWRPLDDLIPRPVLGDPMMPLPRPRPPVQLSAAEEPSEVAYTESEMREALGDELGALVDELTQSTGVQASLAIYLLVGCLGLVTQNLFDVRQPSGSIIGLNRIVLVKAPSAAGKTTLLRLLKEPIAKAEEKFRGEQLTLAPEAEAEGAVWTIKYKAALANIKRRAHEGRSTQEIQAELSTLLRQKPRGLPVPRWLFEDATMEAINAQLTHGWPSLGLMLDEAGQFVSGYMGKKFYHLNKLADGEPISVDRRGAPPLQSKTGRVSLILAMQGGPFDALTSSPHALDSGFFQRAWAVVIERTRGDAIGLLGSAYEWYCKLVNYCLLAEVQLVRAGLPRTTLTFSPEAAARWHKEERGVRLTAEFNAIKEHCPAVLHRFGENVSRTAGMLHAVDQYRNNHGRTEISLETLCTAIAMEKQNLKSVGTILIEGLAEQARERSEILRNWLYEKVYLRCSDECDRVELLRYGSECLRKQSDRDQALRGLIRDGWVVEGTRPPGNAKTVILVKERFSELYRARNPQQAPIIGTWKVLGKRR